VPALAALVVAGFTFLPGVRFARRLVYARLVAPATPDATDEALYGQRLDAYRAALEASIARGTEDEDATFLAALRERFRIDESEHRVLLHYARSSVLIASRSGDNAEHAYERLRLLGEGGAGRTWLARDRLRDRLVVLKEPLERWQRDPKLREAVLREARLAARVRHPNVLSVEEVVEHRGLPVLVLEYAEGGSVADLLRRRGALPWRDAVALQLRILRGVEAIHAAGIVHRDLKPSNVLLASDGSPKVADFGIAIPATTSSTLVEGSTSFVGTMSYVAPEVLAGAVGDPRSDVYSCAAILHECLYGAPPGQPPLPGAADDAPAGLRAVLSDALADDPHRRPPSARALAEALTSRAGQ
jgi:serine/threonine protein kinase